jgi:hypothetical protein
LYKQTNNYIRIYYIYQMKAQRKTLTKRAKKKGTKKRRSRRYKQRGGSRGASPSPEPPHGASATLTSTDRRAAAKAEAAAAAAAAVTAAEKAEKVAPPPKADAGVVTDAPGEVVVTEAAPGEVDAGGAADADAGAASDAGADAGEVAPVDEDAAAVAPVDEEAEGGDAAAGDEDAGAPVAADAGVTDVAAGVVASITINMTPKEEAQIKKEEEAERLIKIKAEEEAEAAAKTEANGIKQKINFKFKYVGDGTIKTGWPGPSSSLNPLDYQYDGARINVALAQLQNVLTEAKKYKFRSIITTITDLISQDDLMSSDILKDIEFYKTSNDLVTDIKRELTNVFKKPGGEYTYTYTFDIVENEELKKAAVAPAATRVEDEGGGATDAAGVADSGGPKTNDPDGNCGENNAEQAAQIAQLTDEIAAYKEAASNLQKLIDSSHETFQGILTQYEAALDILSAKTSATNNTNIGAGAGAAAASVSSLGGVGI